MAGVLPSCFETLSIAATTLRFASAGLSYYKNADSASAASTVPAQVRKSLALKSSPVTSLM
jgi:hypothetical protein